MFLAEVAYPFDRETYVLAFLRTLAVVVVDHHSEVAIQSFLIGAAIARNNTYAIQPIVEKRIGPEGGVARGESSFYKRLDFFVRFHVFNGSTTQGRF